MTEKELQLQKKREVQQSGEPTKPQKQFIPAVDIFETDDLVNIVAEMPGVDKKDVSIGLEEGILTISGSMHGEIVENENPLLKEYETGNYLRRFSMSEDIDQEKIEASMSSGILTVRLPKATRAKPRKIEVKGE